MFAASGDADAAALEARGTRLLVRGTSCIFSVAACAGSLPGGGHRATKLCFLQRFELRQVAAELLRRRKGEDFW